MFTSSLLINPFRPHVHVPLIIVLICFLLSPFCDAATELKFNCGGFATGDGYVADPTAFLNGYDNRYEYDTNSIPPKGLTIGLSHRWSSSEGFAYDFTTGDGQFDIILTFAEIYPPAQSNFRRRFDVFVEDQLEIQNLDVYQVAGADVEYSIEIKQAVVDDGALTIAFRKGSVENPMVSAILIRATNGSDISLEPYRSNTDGTGSRVPDTPPPVANDDDNDSGLVQVWDHQAHAVAGGPYKATDYNGNGLSDVFIDGRRSHSHYSNPDTGESGRIVRYEWSLKDESNSVISTSNRFNYEFPVGSTELRLTVEDQTGDVAVAETDIVVLPVTAAGAYCYYYNGTQTLPKNVDDGPRADEGHSTNVINFFEDTFVYDKIRQDDGSPNEWALRCVTDFQSINTTQYKFSVRYRGAGAVLFVNEGLKASGGSSLGNTDNNGINTISATVLVSDTTVSMQILFYSGGVDDPQLTLLVNDQVAPALSLSYKTAHVIPTISSLSSTQMQPQGGSQLQIVGTGFFNGIVVDIGGKKNVGRTLISSTLIQIPSVPSIEVATSVSAADAVGQDIEANVVVTNNAGSSNVLRVSYTTNAKKGIAWEQTVLKTESESLYVLKQITALTIGPDSRYYLGAYGGFVSRLDIDRDLKVTSKCDSKKLGTQRVILGMAFDYRSQDIRLYVSSNTLYRKREEGGPAHRDWANGAVETFVGNDIKQCSECLCYERRVVSGLPVSGHDHGVNGLLFLPNGDLLVAVGGATNAGVPSFKLGWMDETPLSSAILIASLSKGSAFNGNVRYDNYTHPEQATQVDGFDVQVYASGFRNCFSMTLHTNGQVWATDNGPNKDFGDESTGCNTQRPFTVVGKDEVNLVERGATYGHPNRARGDCVYGDGNAPKQRIQSATTGIVEYTSNAFSGALQGQLVFSKYAASGDGKTWRAAVDGDVLSKPLRMSGFSGVVIENGLYGELLMPKVQKGYISVLKPVYAYAGGAPFVIAVSPNKGRPGHRTLITGEGFRQGMEVKFGGESAGGVQVRDEWSVFCNVPDGVGTVQIELVLDGLSSKGSSGQGGTVKYMYL